MSPGARYPEFEELGNGQMLYRGAALVLIQHLADIGAKHVAAVDRVPLPPAAEAMLSAGRRQAAEVALAAVPMPLPEFIGTEVVSAAEAAGMLGLSPRQVTRRARDMDGRKVGGAWVFERSAVVALAAARSVA